MRLRERAFTKVLSLVGSAVLAGVIVAAAAFPVAAVAGALTKAGVDTFDRLPTDFTSVPTPQSSVVYAADGRTQLTRFFDEDRRNVSLADVAPIMLKAIVASEDSRFYQHHGVDFKGVARAAVSNALGSAQGASTLTMQYVRQSLIYAARTQREVVAATEKTNARKAREMKYALALEKTLDKQQILERYLNIAPFGHGAWGIHSASQVYFGKNPKDLTLSEAALLAGLVQSPTEYDPVDLGNPAKRERALLRREHVFDQMVKSGQITPQEAEQARRNPLRFTGREPDQGCLSGSDPALGAGFFCDYFYRWWLEQSAFGADSYERQNRLRTGGYRIVTSLDPALQRAMRANIGSRIGNADRRALMLSALDPTSGRVMALATNRDFSLDDRGNPPNPNPEKRGRPGTFPNTTNQLLAGGGGVYGYQAGSTFKMFTMVAALEQGLPLSYSIDAPDRYHSRLYKTSARDRSACAGTEDYCPRNASEKMKGRHDMWTGFGQSVNTYFVPLEEKVGAERVVDVAGRMGIRFRAQNDLDNATNSAHVWGAFTLGVSATTPVDLAGAYGTLANDGVRCAPTPVVEIRDPAGNRLEAGNPACTRAIPADVARAAIDAARCPVGDRGGLRRCGGSTAGDVSRTVGRPVFGKTGTTDTNESATLVAATRQLSIAGIEADPDWPGDPTADHNHVNDAVAQTLRDGMRDKAGLDFPPPPRRLVGERSAPSPGPSGSRNPRS